MRHILFRFFLAVAFLLLTAPTAAADHNPVTGPSAPDPDWWMIALTAGLVVVGAGQVWVLVRQTHIINDGLAETRTATELTRKSLVLTQRPRLIVRNIVVEELGRLDRKSPDPHLSDVLNGRYYVANIGSTRGEIREVYAQLLITKEPLPMARPYEFISGTQVSDKSIEPGMSALVTIDPVTLTPVQLHAIMGRETDVYLLGFVLYSDGLGNLRRTAFCRKFDHKSRRFCAIDDDPDYEHAE